MPDINSMTVFVHSVHKIADGITCLDLRSLEDRLLPHFTAGSHIDLHLPGGMVRSYSLCNDPEERNRYLIAVSLEKDGRGGSRYVHQSLKAGDRILISGPRNNFALEEHAEQSVFIVGGIGITPVMSMIRRLEKLGRPWTLHYSSRQRSACAFREELSQFNADLPGKVSFNFDREPGAARTDLRSLVHSIPKEAHVYCCGPAGMLEAFEEAARLERIPRDRVHVEYFSPRQEAATARSFEVTLAKSGQQLWIAEGRTILEVLLELGIDLPFSCLQGVCGSCETGVLGGVPDHRDSVLSDSEREGNKTMMICCSGSLTESLVLDL